MVTWHPLRDLAGDATYLAEFLRTLTGPIALVGSPLRRECHLDGRHRQRPGQGARLLQCWYLLGTQDKAIPPALQRFMAERGDGTIVEVAASHVSFVSQSEAATQLILQAVEATSHSRT